MKLVISLIMLCTSIQAKSLICVVDVFKVCTKDSCKITQTSLKYHRIIDMKQMKMYDNTNANQLIGNVNITKNKYLIIGSGEMINVYVPISISYDGETNKYVETFNWNFDVNINFGTCVIK